MKFYLFILALIALSFQTIAQSSLLVTDHSNSQLAVANNGMIFITTGSNSSESTIINIKNTSATAKSYKLKRYDDVLNAGAYALFEVGSIGYAPSVTITPSSVTLTANGTTNDDLLSQNELFKLDLMEAVTPGISHIRYEIFEVNNINDVFTFTIYYNDFASFINEPDLNFIDISEPYPNPSTNSVYVTVSSYESLKDVSITITNNIGELISSHQVNLNQGKNSIMLNSKSLNTGIYFAEISYNKKTIVKKIIIN